MIVLRRTQKPATALPASTSAEPLPPSDTALGDGYVNKFVVDRNQLLLLVSAQSLLPILIPPATFAAFRTICRTCRTAPCASRHPAPPDRSRSKRHVARRRRENSQPFPCRHPGRVRVCGPASCRRKQIDGTKPPCRSWRHTWRRPQVSPDGEMRTRCFPSRRPRSFWLRDGLRSQPEFAPTAFAPATRRGPETPSFVSRTSSRS